MNMRPRNIRPVFEPRRMDPCFCNSGKRFKSCCGSMDSNRRPPFGVQVIRNFISKDQCVDWVERAETKERSWLKVVDSEKSTVTQLVRKAHPGRVTEKVVLGELEEEVNAAIRRAIRERIEPYYKRKICWFESGSMLRYTKGGIYRGHADSDNFDVERDHWYQCLDRDVSLLIYLNNDFTGGALRFTRFNYLYRPRIGDLLFFPSDVRYMHEAERVESGVRYAIVSWSAFSNAERVMENQSESNIILDPTGI